MLEFGNFTFRFDRIGDKIAANRDLVASLVVGFATIGVRVLYLKLVSGPRITPKLRNNVSVRLDY